MTVTTEETAGLGALLRQRGFAALLATQFLGAMNDNAFKVIVSLVLLKLGSGAVAGLDGRALLGITGAVFVLPFVLFSGLAGQLADSFDKRRLLAVAKALEVPAMLLAYAGLAAQSVPMLLGTLFLLSTQAAFFGPAKYGILPEMFPPQRLTGANALVQSSTMLAIILGTALGGYLLQASGGHAGWLVLALVAIAGLGFAASLGILRAPQQPGLQRIRPRLAPWAGLGAGAQILRAEPNLRLAVLGSAWCWGVAALVTAALLAFASQTLLLAEARAGELQATVGIGIALGALAASRLAGGRIALGGVPVGASLIFLALLVLPLAGSYAAALLPLALLGFGAGFYLVPMEAFTQATCPPEQRGRLMGIAAVLDGVAMLLGSLAMSGLAALGLTPAGILWAAAASIGVPLVVSWKVLPMPGLRMLLRLVLGLVLRLRVEGADKVPASGGVAVVANHVSYIDAALLLATCPRPLRFMSDESHYRMALLNPFMRAANAIPVQAGSRRSVVAALAAARDAVKAGDAVGIFPEGGFTRTGQLLPFQRGVERVLDGTGAVAVPVCLDGLWGVPGSWQGGRMWALGKWLRLLRRPIVTVRFGDPLSAEAARAPELHQRVQRLSSAIAVERAPASALLHRRVVRVAKRRWRHPAIADTTGRKLTYGELLIGLILLRRRLKGRLGPARHVAVLLPASAGAVMANVALAMLDRPTVNLNFTAGPDAVRAALETAGVDSIVTSRKFIEKAGLEALVAGERRVLALEDVLKDIGKGEKLRAAALALLVPARLLSVLLDAGRADAARTATVLFSSGTTGTPKGVVLTHRNIQGVTGAAERALEIDPQYGFLGVLPPFHAFGYTVLLWLPLLVGARAVYHANPAEGKVVARLVDEHKLTVMVTTPSFLAGWLRVGEPAQFASLRYIVTGAEKLRPELAEKVQELLGQPVLEGYGMTEMGPAVGVSLPPVTRGAVTQTGSRPGSVGQPFPGVAFRIVDRETGADLPVGQEGMILIDGPGRMAGYLNDPARTAAALQDGWYVTGDIGRLDEDGFLYVTDRLARFSKLGGEMVPHGAVEAALAALPGIEAAAVVGVPHATKGEQLVAFVVPAPEVPFDRSAVWSALQAGTLPRLWLPRADALVPVEALPTLASGKLDLAGLRAQALARGEGERTAPQARDVSAV